MELERYGAHNYHPLPVVLDRGEGVHVWDVEGEYYISWVPTAQSTKDTATGCGCLTEQRQECAFYNSKLGEYEVHGETFGFDKILPMNSGAEAVETAIKIARKWGMKKGVEKTGIIVFVKAFHGRTTTYFFPTTKTHVPTLAHIPRAS